MKTSQFNSKMVPQNPDERQHNPDMNPDQNSEYNKVSMSNDKLLSRLQELEAHNSSLELLLEQRTARLTDIVSTNAKFLSIIAHDLRSPFGSIIGILELLKMSLKDLNRNQVEEYINIVYNSANNTLVLLDNLLIWAISQNKEKNFSPVKINLYKLLSEEIDNLKTVAAQKHIAVYNKIEETDLNVAADLQMVKTIIRNLISNAIKYTNKHGVIAVNASIINKSVEIEVRDNGIGISEADQKKLFKIDEFHSTPGTQEEAGTGLGLLLCKEFAELHGSSIRIDSKPGMGSSFSFSLPHYS